MDIYLYCISMEKTELFRGISASQTFQGAENTCYAHVVARLWVKNIFKVPDETEKVWDMFSNCNYALDTSSDKYITLISPAKCGKDGYLKICLFLYIYYVAKEYAEAKSGKNKGGSIQTSNYHIKKHIIEDKKGEPEQFKNPRYQPMLSVASQYLKEQFKPKMGKNIIIHQTFTIKQDITSDTFTPYVNLILLLLHENMYMGLSIIGTGVPMGHGVTIIGYYSSKKSFIIKNTWGKKISFLPVNLVGTTFKFDDHDFVNATFVFDYLLYTNTHHFMTAAGVRGLIKKMKSTYVYSKENPFRESNTPSILPQPDMTLNICRGNKECPISTCNSVTRNRPRTTNYCRRRRTRRTNLKI
jgi:hypothetical protein